MSVALLYYFEFTPLYGHNPFRVSALAFARHFWAYLKKDWRKANLFLIIDALERCNLWLGRVAFLERLDMEDRAFFAVCLFIFDANRRCNFDPIANLKV